MSEVTGTKLVNLTVMFSGAPTTTMSVTMAPTTLGLAAALDRHEVLLPPSLWHSTNLSPRLILLCQLCQSPPQVRLLFWSLVFHQFLYIGVYCGVCFLLSGLDVAAMFTNWDLTVGFALPQPLEYTCGGICASCCWTMAHARGTLSSCSLQCFDYWGASY